MWQLIMWVGRRRLRDARELVLHKAAVEQGNERDAAFRRIIRLAHRR